MAGILAVGNEAFVSHLTGGRLWGLLLPEPDRIDILTPHGRWVRLPGVRHHRTNVLPEEDISRVKGIPVTTPARVLCDCSGLVPAKQLAIAIDDARRRKLLSLERLRQCHERLDNGPGRRPTAVMRQLLAERKPGSDPGASDRERWVGDVLEKAGLQRPVPRYKVRIGNRTYEIDHAYPEVMVAVEFDSWEFHGTYTAFHADRKRWRVLGAAGWRLAIVTSQTTPNELVSDVTGLLAVAQTA